MISETGAASEPGVGADATSPTAPATPSTGIVVALVLGVVELGAVWLWKQGRAG